MSTVLGRRLDSNHPSSNVHCEVRWAAFACVALLFACSDPAPDVVPGADVTTADVTAVDATVVVGAKLKRLWVGINDFPEQMMGLKPVTVKEVKAPFFWHVPTSGGFSFEVHVEHDGGWQPVATPRFSCGALVISDVLGAAASTADVFKPASGSWTKTKHGHTWRARVLQWDPDAWAPDGAVCGSQLRVEVDGVSSSSVAVKPYELTAALDPFDKVDRWFVDFRRDIGELKVVFKDEQFSVTTPRPATPDGVSDFEEGLAALGLLGGDGVWRKAMVSLIRERVRQHLRQIYMLDEVTGEIGPESVRIVFAFNGDDDAPKTPLASGWSMIAVGGEDKLWKTGGTVVYGRAAIDFHNKKRNINTAANRGVFITALVRLVLENPVLSFLVKDFAPAANGQPFGSLAGDEVLLQDKLAPKTIADPALRARAERFGTIVRLLSLAISAVTAHEIGHSLGLVKPGLPPKGLFGGLTKATWMQAQVDHHHIDLPGLNIMQTGVAQTTGPSQRRPALCSVQPRVPAPANRCAEVGRLPAAWWSREWSSGLSEWASSLSFMQVIMAVTTPTVQLDAERLQTSTVVVTDRHGGGWASFVGPTKGHLMHWAVATFAELRAKAPSRAPMSAAVAVAFGLRR